MATSHLVSFFVSLACLIPLINAQWTLNPCGCDSECEEPRKCMFFEPPFVLAPCTPDKTGCICSFTGVGSIPCNFNFDCYPGDVCVDRPATIGSKTCVSQCARDEANCPESTKTSKCVPPSATPSPTKTPAPTPSKTPRPKPSKTPRPKPSKTPRPKPSKMPRPKPSKTPRPKPSKTPKPKPSRKPKPKPSRKPKPKTSKKPRPRRSKTPKPSSSPSLEPPIVSTKPPAPGRGEQPEGALEESPNLETEFPDPPFTPEATKQPRRVRRPEESQGHDEGTGTGLTRDSCTEASECKPPRKCYTTGSMATCDLAERCECTPPSPVLCEDDNDCDDGEQCFDDSGEDQEKTCVSTCYFYKMNDPEKYAAECMSADTESTGEQQPTPMVSPPAATALPILAPGEASPTPTPTEVVCVAAEELEGVEKVFEKDFHAWVLCDARGSCATAGHMVMWNGVGMMMKSYCEEVGCEKKVMAVNSPRWRAGAVRAKSDGLAYTSFAARFETRAEERVLAAVVRLVV